MMLPLKLRVSHKHEAVTDWYTTDVISLGPTLEGWMPLLADFIKLNSAAFGKKGHRLPKLQ